MKREAKPSPVALSPAPLVVGPCKHVIALLPLLHPILFQSVRVCKGTPANGIDHISKNTVIVTIPNVGLHGGDGVRVAHGNEAPKEVG